MGLLITLRQNNRKSYFRENLLGMISKTRPLEANRLILAYGYFSEYDKKGHSVYDDGLKEAITDNSKITEIDVIGSKGSKKSVTNFCNNIQSLGRKDFFSINVPKNNWHAKIAMIL